MTTADAIDLQYIVDTTVDLCQIPSPTGFTHQAAERVCDLLGELGMSFETTVKGSIVAHLPATADGPGRLLSAHIDTLGVMVREIKGDGRLKLALVGGFDWSTIEGEYCLVHRASGDPVSGTILTTKASYHVHGSALVDLKRDADSMEIRLDELVRSADDVRSLGIEVGDFVSLDARTTVTSSGFIKSRHIDDKACAAICLGVAKAVVDGNLTLPAPTALYFSVFEEVGHGTSAGIPDGVRDVIAVDMAAVGAGQRSDERKVTICAKDSSGPYHYGFTRELIDLAAAEGIGHCVDLYPYYGSDVSQALRAGYDIRGALFGPGVDASHSFERTHRDALRETARLLLAWIQTSS